MINSKSIENFWTRGDIFSRVHRAMSEAGLINKELNIEDLFPIDQYHARGIAATVDLGTVSYTHLTLPTNREV